MQYKEIIEQAFSDEAFLNQNKNQLQNTLLEVLTELEIGNIRTANVHENKWQANEWVKKAILLYFKLFPNEKIPGAETNFFDKVPLRFQGSDDIACHKIRVVPGALVRRGSHIGKSTVIMPSFVNIGAYIDTGCMIDTWATVGSCAQIGKDVHISGGAGIGGVLEPLQAQPTIIENNCFIGARSEVVEGVIVKEHSVLSMGVYIGQSTKIYNKIEHTISYGEIPAGAVVIPGNLPSEDGKYSTYAAIIVKFVDEKTKSKVAINKILRDSK